MLKLTGAAHNVSNYLSLLIVSLSLIGILFTLLNNINDRKYDLAILRTLGLYRKKIFSLILIEGMTITFIGSVIGIILGAIIFISVQYFSLFGTNVIIGQFEFVSELLIMWLIVMIW